MSEQHFAKTTRRDFLGSATLATAATLTVPGASEVQSAGANNSTERTKMAQSDYRAQRRADGAVQTGRLDEAGGDGHPERGIFRA
jgi:hypothetical protein